MKLAVIVTTYNRPDALRAVLDGYLAQSDRAFELIVADDGSTGDTRRLVEQYQARRSIDIRHVWQADQGFRAAAIRNRAVAATPADYLVFSDGDCVPVHGFVAAHRKLAQRGCFLAANRVLLSEKFTRRALADQIPIHDWRWWQWLAAWRRKDVNRWMPLLRLPDSPIRSMRARRWEGVKTCNLSLWREDFVKVNGLDESYEGWGLEDSDLVIRLLHAGVCHKSARFAAPVFHLWHRENDRSRLAENQRLLDALTGSDKVHAAVGLDRYLAGRA